jgi:hypothetical protein
MDKSDILQRIRLLEKRIEELPKGYISKKTIRGRQQLYLQWRKGDRVCSRYIKKAEREQIISQIEERRELNLQLDKLKSELSIADSFTPGTSDDSAGAISCSMVAEKLSGYSSVSANADSPFLIRHYLKWEDDTIGFVDSGNRVEFSLPDYNETVRLYTAGSSTWTEEQFASFLKDRIVSRSRRDIETLLRRMDLTGYDIFDVAAKTHMISAKDRLWLADSPDEKYNEALTDVFHSVFILNVDSEGDSVDTPEGQNEKRYGVFNGKYGIYKKRLSPLITDVESEIAAYALAEKLGVPCCRVFRADEDTVFSVFEYDFNSEYIVHFRRLVENYKNAARDGRLPAGSPAGAGMSAGEDLLSSLIAVRPQYFREFAALIAFDFITRQDDRHLSNIAVRIGNAGESFYPLYDNGRSLFYEDTEETVEKACRDIRKFASSFGHEGSYYDHAKRLAGSGISFSRIIDLDVPCKEVRTILEDAGFTGYRLAGAEEWIMKCMKVLKQL